MDIILLVSETNILIRFDFGKIKIFYRNNLNNVFHDQSEKPRIFQAKTGTFSNCRWL
jgi:hypothetical protein